MAEQPPPSDAAEELVNATQRITGEGLAAALEHAAKGIGSELSAVGLSEALKEAAKSMAPGRMEAAGLSEALKEAAKSMAPGRMEAAGLSEALKEAGKSMAPGRMESAGLSEALKEAARTGRALAGLGISDDLKRAFGRTAELTSSLDGALAS